jgi:2'-5' RNA ligase
LRRGLSLALRPCRTVRDAISGFLDQLAAVAPGQYCYRPEEFHVTVLSIIPGSVSWRERFQQLPAYQTLIDGVMKNHRAFSIAFQGVTASRGGVMIQGFPSDDTLARIRNELREAMQRNRFGEQLDVRYKINTAHVTVMRFCNPDLNGKNLLTILQANRSKEFGETRVDKFELILCDWYASASTARILQEYKLAG